MVFKTAVIWTQISTRDARLPLVYGGSRKIITNPDYISGRAPVEEKEEPFEQEKEIVEQKEEQPTEETKTEKKRKK